ncbi:MAG: DUF4625 domain-containing protein [Candidatus Pseudobacter hemicellulosilyticus]|uniref:DUF4625 domain-containing protein n=1 Tax=Candidatus Pseudobacter hemicellulosilyticus TaxID=3121375 RepID=A0AAJ6BIK1_9BACT|nr:MAG: DUF4625 domain-containing protein [Pseudobacter sp.]
MNPRTAFVGLFLLSIFFFGCSKSDKETDSSYPEIDLHLTDAFPIQCSTVERGKPLQFKGRFTDNKALGSFSLDIHHNFDQHTHSTEVNNCEAEAIKTPVKPLVYVKSWDIPAGTTDYTATATIDIPADVDPGDYHFLIRLTDAEGWQTIRGISIKIL